MPQHREKIEDMKKLKTVDIELAVASYLGLYMNLIVPNVRGIGLHECDLLVVSNAGYAWEVEIKISKADLIKDKEKKHGHSSSKIKYLYFAIPDYLLDCLEHIPERAGIISVNSKSLLELLYNERNLSSRDLMYLMGERCCKTIRKPIGCKKPYKFSEAERFKVAMLGSMRIWGLKRKLLQQTHGDEQKEKDYE